MVVIWSLIVAPYVLRIPDSFSYSADLVSFDNFYDAEIQDFVGATESSSTFGYTVKNVQPGVLSIQNIFSVQALSGEELIHIDRLYGINPTTRQHVSGFGDRDRTGYLFAPEHLREGQNFTYWHVNYDLPAEMHYVNTQTLGGLEVFYYTATLHPDQTSDLGALPYVGETMGIDLDVVLELWVEPRTGWLVKYTDQATGYYYDLGTHSRIHPWNSFSNTYTEAAVAREVTIAKQARILSIWVGTVIPWIFVFFCVLSSIPLLMMRVHVVDRLIRRAAPFIIACLGCAISMFGWYFSSNVIFDQKLHAFYSDADEIVGAIAQRMSSYEKVLHGTKSFFDASEKVTQDEWETYVRGLHIGTYYPGIEVFGYAPLVLEQDKDVFAASRRSAKLPEYAIHPDSSQPTHLPVQYLEPTDDRNSIIYGYDLFSDAVRRESVERARDTGNAAVSGKVVLLQRPASIEDPAAGFLIVVPYYGGRAVYTVAERRAAFTGAIYAPVRMSDVVESVNNASAQRVAVNIYDGLINQNEEAMLYKSTAMDVASAQEHGLLSMTREVFVYGRKWTFVVAQLPTVHYRSTFERMFPWIILISGFVISVLGGVLLYIAERGYLNVKPERKRHS